MKYTSKDKAIVLLSDGTIFYGKSVGIKGTTTGEICFNTGVTGYQEIFTDPSYFGQIMLSTTAHIGNYGVHVDEVDSDGIKLSEPTKFEYHPGSNIKMIGFQIPYYKEICDMITNAALVTKSLRFIGWDVAISKNGPILLEGNIAYAATVNGEHGIYKEMKQYL